MRTLVSKTEYNLHIQRHIGEKPYDCKVCNTAFITQNKLYRHVKSHIDKLPSPPHGLQHKTRKNITELHGKHGECGNELTTLLSQLHKFTESNKTFNCPLCSRNYKRLLTMLRHLSAVHTPHRHFRCDQCDTQFTRKDNLNRHLRNQHPGINFRILQDSTKPI